jgi:hypothetical protein
MRRKGIIFKTIFLVFLGILLHSHILANDTIRIGEGMFGIDPNKKMIVVNQDVDSINATWLLPKGSIFIDNKHYAIEIPVDKIQIGIAYRIFDAEYNKYILYFTQLPLIQITTPNTIVDEPKVAATFKMSESNSNRITSDIGIEIRGSFSQSFPKKSFRIGFWEDSTGDENKDVSLLGMRSDDDWNLQAMYNEPLRMRNKTNFDIWRKINTLYYQSNEKEAVNGSRWEYAELFLNGEYRGIYGVSEPVDRKQLKLKKYEDGIRGELYKGIAWGPAIFSYLPPRPKDNSPLWDGFEYEYPDEIAPDWTLVYNFVDFVINSSDKDFYSQYQTRFNIENAVDYFIFLNLLNAEDNTGKNLFIAKYKAQEPYFYVPWDLDGTFGIKYDGSQQNKTDTVLSNGFYKRLLNDHSGNGFHAKLTQKWNQLRNDWLTTDNLMDMFHENQVYLLKNGAYEREEVAWKDYHFDSEQLQYMRNWIMDRLMYLDATLFYKTGIANVQNGEIQYPCDVYIYNINGTLIKSIHMDSINNHLLYSNLNKGIYLIHFQNANQHKVQKMIIH